MKHDVLSRTSLTILFSCHLGTTPGKSYCFLMFLSVYSTLHVVSISTVFSEALVEKQRVISRPKPGQSLTNDKARQTELLHPKSVTDGGIF